MRIRIFLFLAIILLGACMTGRAYGVTDADMEKMCEELREARKDFEKMQSIYESKIKNMQARIEKLEEMKGVSTAQGTDVAAPAAATVVTAPAQPSIVSAGLGRYFQSFNPDISVIGDADYHWTDHKRSEYYQQFQFRQLELAFSSAVDPYGRADVFTHVEQEDGDWHIGLCEGYLTLLTLPWDFQAKFGKFKSDFGKVNKLHLHALPWVDYPSVVTNFFGEEGMSEPGVALSHMVPNPWDIYSEVTVEAFKNKNARAFAGNDGRDLVFLTHWKNFFELTPEQTFELGGSLAVGPNDDGKGRQKTMMEGVDLTYKWRPLKKGLYRSLILEGEFYGSQKDRSAVYGDNVFVDGDGVEYVVDPILERPRDRVDAIGFYGSVIYQFARRWSVFSRYDYSEYPDNQSMRDKGVSGGITFAQSEYCFWRLQYKNMERNYDKNDNQIWLQCNFGIGPHRKHEY